MNGNEKALDINLEPLDESNIGDLSEIQKAAPLPVATQPLNDSLPNQTQSHLLLHFTISDDLKSIYKKNYHPINNQELNKLNKYALNLQNSAQWYLTELANSEVSYIYTDGKEQGILKVNYSEENFQHLTGIFPIKEGQNSSLTLKNFAQGEGNFENIMIANRGAAFEKIQVLPQLSDIIDARSFVFNDLSEVEKFGRLNVDSAVASEDKDILLAFRSVDDEKIPASLIKVNNSLKITLEKELNEKIILGVIREREGVFDVLSINENYIKDEGNKLVDVLKSDIREKKKESLDQEKMVQRDEIPQNKQSYQKKGFKRIPEEQVQNAKNTSILAYAQAQGIQLEKTAQNEYRVSGTKIKFSTDKNLFSDYAGNTKNNGNKESGDVIAFAKYMKGLNFGQAVRDVLGTEGAGTYEVSQEQVPFNMPKSIINPERFEEGMVYMTKNRMIDSNMVLDLYRSGLIRQTKNGEVAFIWADGAEDVGLTLQGTQPLDYRSQITENEKGGYDWKTGIGPKGLDKYPLKTDHAETYEQAEEAVAEDIAHRRPFKKQIWKNSTPKKGFNFTKTVPKEQMTKSSLSLGESAIDCISFAENQAERFRESGHLAVFQSLEGAHTKIATAVQAVEDFKTKYGQLPDEVIIATDNDKDGNLVEDKFKALPPVQEYMKQGMKVVRAKPDHGKDWNDALKFSKSPTQQVPHPRVSPNLPKGRSM